MATSEVSLPEPYCEREFSGQGLVTQFVQVNNSPTPEGDTARHALSAFPKAETKLVRCIRGALYDAILDLRHGSPTFGESFGAELSAENRTNDVRSQGLCTRLSHH